MIKKVLGIVLFVLSILSLIIGFSVVASNEDIFFFEMAGLLHNMWILYLFAIIPLLSIIYGFIGLKKAWPHRKKNIIVGFIMLPLMVIYGSFGIIFSSTTDYTDAIFRDAENKMSLTLPTNLKCATIKLEESGDLGIAKILSSSEQTTFENSLLSNPWIDALPSAIKNVLPAYVSAEVIDFDYYCFYDVTSDAFNTVSLSDGTYDTILLAYQSSIAKIVAFDNYQVIVNS